MPAGVLVNRVPGSCCKLVSSHMQTPAGPAGPSKLPLLPQDCEQLPCSLQNRLTLLPSCLQTPLLLKLKTGGASC